MPDTYVLVPMRLDAMVLNQEASLATPFLRFQMNYQQLQSFNDPEPRPFAGASPTPPGAGIYLHWTLPKALRNGIHQDDGSIAFPLVPNRYLVVRLQAGAPAAQAAKAWVLESDHLGSDGTSPFVDPSSLGQYGTPTPTKIGRATLLSALQSLEVQANPFLKAIGPGNVTFSTFSPGVQNVFSFYDDVTENDGTTPIGQATFTYYVAGWYSDPAHDPLAATEWQANPDLPGTYANKPLDPAGWSNDWFVYAAGAGLPRQMVVHGLVFDVPWDRQADNPPATNYPTDIQNMVKVAVGNTAIDALSAIVRLHANSQTEADLLGTDIMYDTGFDPHAMSQFFQKLEAQGGSRGPQFLSDHRGWDIGPGASSGPRPFL